MGLRLGLNSGQDSARAGSGVHWYPQTDPATTSLALSVNIQLNYQRRQLNSAGASAEENFHRESERRWRCGQAAAGRRTKSSSGVSLRTLHCTESSDRDGRRRNVWGFIIYAIQLDILSSQEELSQLM